MPIDIEDELMKTIREGIREGVKSKLTGYNSPLEKLLNDSINAQGNEIRALMSEALSSCLNDKQFREDIKAGTRHILAKQLVQKFGGELEKQVNSLKSDPATRARITLAIDEIVSSKSA